LQNNNKSAKEAKTGGLNAVKMVIPACLDE
jgi:hypothetical protein